MLGVPAERLYYTDCYLTEFRARVEAVSPDGTRVYLDRTAFYPESGGQPSDLGHLDGVLVSAVEDDGDMIVHTMAEPVRFGVGSELGGSVDWPKRYDHMCQHTGQHLLSAVWEELFGFETLSFHMGPLVSTIELGAKEISDDQITRVEKRANEVASEGRPVSIRFEDVTEAKGLRKASERSGRLRIVEIQGLDKSACGGTHVRSIAETLPIQIRRQEKVRGNVRLEFVCGARALAAAKNDFRLLQELVRQSGAPPDRLIEHYAGLKARLAGAEKQVQKLSVELARRQGEELYNATKPSADGIRRARLDVDQIDEATRSLASAFSGQGKAILLALAKTQGGVLVACSTDTGLHAGNALKDVLTQAGGRGGGSATLGQGSSPDPAIRITLLEKFGF